MCRAWWICITSAGTWQASSVHLLSTGQACIPQHACPVRGSLAHAAHVQSYPCTRCVHRSGPRHVQQWAQLCTMRCCASVVSWLASMNAAAAHPRQASSLINPWDLDSPMVLRPRRFCVGTVCVHFPPQYSSTPVQLESLVLEVSVHAYVFGADASHCYCYSRSAGVVITGKIQQHTSGQIPPMAGEGTKSWVPRNLHCCCTCSPYTRVHGGHVRLRTAPASRARLGYAANTV